MCFNRNITVSPWSEKSQERRKTFDSSDSLLRSLRPCDEERCRRQAKCFLRSLQWDAERSSILSKTIVAVTRPQQIIWTSGLQEKETYYGLHTSYLDRFYTFKILTWETGSRPLYMGVFPLRPRHTLCLLVSYVSWNFHLPFLQRFFPWASFSRYL